MRRTIDDQQLELFRARPGDMALRDAQDLMSWPFFSLAKTRRVQPIDFRMGEVSIRVEATPEHGMATIWDADVLIWAASQIVDARTYRRPLVTRFVLNRCTTRTVIARETAAALADHDPPMLRQRIGQRVAFADAAKTGRLVWEVGAANSAVRDVNGFANEVGRSRDDDPNHGQQSEHGGSRVRAEADLRPVRATSKPGSSHRRRQRLPSRRTAPSRRD